MPDGVAVSREVLLGGDTALALVVAMAPLLSAEAVAPLADALRRTVPAAGSPSDCRIQRSNSPRPPLALAIRATRTSCSIVRIR